MKVVLVCLCIVSVVVATSVPTNILDDPEAGHWWPQGHPRQVAQAQRAAAAAASPSSTPAFRVQSETEDHFTYVRADNGPLEWGPAHWSSYSGGAPCSGSAQSPIDIATAVQDDSLAPLKANWGSFTGSLVNNGHTIQVNIDSGNGNLTGGVQADPAQVVQFHVHYNSEHQLAGASHPLELHIVHGNTNAAAVAADASLELAVVGFFFKEGTSTNTFFEPIISALATLNTSNTVDVSINLSGLAALLPGLSYFNYKGSLTAPNCRETVTWYVMDTVLEIEGSQLDLIRDQFLINNRPVQPLNGRVVKTNKNPWSSWSQCVAGTQTRTCKAGIVTCTGATSQACVDAKADEDSDKITTTQALSAATVGLAAALILIVFVAICYHCCCRHDHGDKHGHSHGAAAAAPAPPQTFSHTAAAPAPAAPAPAPAAPAAPAPAAPAPAPAAGVSVQLGVVAGSS